jgi:lipopolysaccharide transport system permease protein
LNAPGQRLLGWENAFIPFTREFFWIFEGMEVKVYTPRREESIATLFREIFLGFKEGRELAWRLFVRDLKAGYRKSYLGMFWLFLPPLATAGVWIFLNRQQVVSISDAPMAYAGFTLCGTILWSLFSESITKPIQRYQGAMSMMTKLNFPREAIVLASVYDLLFSFALKLVILIPILWILGYPPSLNFIPAFLAVAGLIITGLVIGVGLSPIGLLYSDIGKGLPIVLPFVMYLTPVIYPLRTEGTLSALQGFNPVTPFLERARSLIGGYEFTLNQEMWIWAGIIAVAFFIALAAIRIALPVIVERSGS